MDESAPWTVLQGTLTISALSAVTTGVWGILKGQERYGFLAGAAALNSGMTAAAFFSIREYVVGPILVRTMPLKQYEVRRQELGIDHSTPETGALSTIDSGSQFSVIRGQKVLDSTLSGIFTGGLLRGLKSGPRTVLSGAISVGVAATFLQLGYNEFTIQRLKYIFRRRSQDSLRENSLPIFPQPTSGVSEGIHRPQSASWKAKVLRLMGVRKMPEEEYLQRLKFQREHYLVRIKKLEQQLENEKGREEN